MSTKPDELLKLLIKHGVVLHPSDIEIDVERMDYLTKDIQAERAKLKEVK